MQYHRLSDDFIFHSFTLHVYEKLFEQLKSQFQVIFGQDSFPLKMSPFQVCLLQKSTNSFSSLIDGGIRGFTITLFLQKNFPSLLASAWFVVRYFSFVEQTVLVVFLEYSFLTTKSPILFHMPADDCFWILPVWSHIWYFWISFSCILMQIAPVNGYIQWNYL